MQSTQTLEIIGKVSTPCWLPLAVGHLSQVVCMRNVIHTRDQCARVGFAVCKDAANRDATEADAAIAALATDQTCTLTFTACTVVGECHFESCVNGLGARVREEDTIKTSRHHLSNFFRCFKGEWVTHLEWRRVVELHHLLVYSFSNFVTAVTSVYAPEPGTCIEYFLAISRCEVHAFCAFQNARCSFKLLVASKRHPEIGHVQIC